MPSSPSPDGPALSRFRHSLTLALSTHSRPAFDAACRSLALSTTLPLAHLLSSPPLLADPQLSLLLAAAADRHWLDLPQPPTSTWAAVLKRSHPSAPPFLPPRAPRSAPLPTDPAAPPKTSFRRWKWDAASLPSPSPLHRDLPSSPSALPPDDASSLASSSSPAHDPPSDAKFEAALLAGMPCSSDARPAAAAAAAAFRALTPFLPADQRAALRRAFATHPPADCLAMVVRVAEHASANHVRTHHLQPHQPHAARNQLPQPLSHADGLLGLPGAQRGVWGTGFAAGWPDKKDDAWDDVYGTGRSKGAATGGSSLDANAPPFRIERTLHGRTERL